MSLDALPAAFEGDDPNELVQLLLRLHGTSVAYRGQGNAAYPLATSLRRRLTHKPKEERRRLEQAIVASFATAIGDQIDLSSMSTGDVISLMQHHRAPTRFLDFSLSPLVALYFASESLSAEDGRIYVVDLAAAFISWHKEARRIGKDAKDYGILPEHDTLRSLQETNLAIQLDEAIHLPLPYRPSSASVRMRSQSGVFLVESLSRDWVDDAGEIGFLRSITFPSSMKQELLRIALRTNNGAASLFPGLDGIGREIVERYTVGEQAEFGFAE